MPIVLDTSLLVAYANTDDPDHERAKTIMRRVLQGRHGTPVSLDYVLDEGLTVLQRRTGDPADAKLFASYFVPMDASPLGPILEYLRTPEDVIESARGLFFERFERRLSFTDCVVACLAGDLDGSVGAVEDRFEGIVPAVTA